MFPNYLFYSLEICFSPNFHLLIVEDVALGGSIFGGSVLATSGFVHTPQLSLQFICMYALFLLHSPIFAQCGQLILSSLQTNPGHAPLSMKISSKAVSE